MGARRSRAWVLANPAYLVDPGTARVRAPAPWLTRGDLETIREDSGLLGRRYSFFTPGLAELFREAYARSPWVERVAGVRLVYPDRVEVGLFARRPAAAVPFEDGVVLVDDRAVRLPGVRREKPRGVPEPFLPLLGVRGRPPDPGEVWSGQVREGVAVAAALRRAPPGLVEAAGIVAIDVSGVGKPIALAEPEIVLLHRDGVRIEWGRSVLSPLAALDPPVEDKLRRLSQALRAFPDLSGLARVKLQYDALYTVPKTIRGD